MPNLKCGNVEQCYATDKDAHAVEPTCIEYTSGIDCEAVDVIAKMNWVIRDLCQRISELEDGAPQPVDVWSYNFDGQVNVQKWNASAALHDNPSSIFNKAGGFLGTGEHVSGAADATSFDSIIRALEFTETEDPAQFLIFGYLYVADDGSVLKELGTTNEGLERMRLYLANENEAPAVVFEQNTDTTDIFGDLATLSQGWKAFAAQVSLSGVISFDEGFDNGIEVIPGTPESFQGIIIKLDNGGDGIFIDPPISSVLPTPTSRQEPSGYVLQDGESFDELTEINFVSL